MIKGVVFDKDGTLLDYEKFWLPVAENAVKILLKSKNISLDYEKDMLESVGAYDGISGVLCYGTYMDITSVFNKTLKSEVFSVDEVEKAFEESIPCGKMEPTCKNIREVFKALKEMNLKIALITSDNDALSRFCLKVLGIEEFFDDLFTADENHPSKPDPYYMNCFCEKYNFSSNEVVMAGDTLTDMNFAKNSGTIPFGVAKNKKDASTLSPFARLVKHDISYVIDFINEFNKE